MSKTPLPKTTWEAWVVWVVWEVACQVWKAWAVTGDLVASVSLHILFENAHCVLIKLDFSKLGGGAGGMPDMGDLGADAEGGADEDEDDEMPGLEDEEAEGEEGKGKGKETKEPATSSKIEEVS